MHLKDKTELIGRIGDALIMMAQVPERMEQRLNELGVPQVPDLSPDADWRTKCNIRLRLVNDDELIRIATEVFDLDINDILFEIMADSNHRVHYSSGAYNNFVLRVDLQEIGILQVGYYIIENPIIPSELDSRLVYSVLRINPFCTPVENLNLDITARWMGGLYSTREEAMFAMNEDFKKGIEDFSQEGREQ